MACKAMVDALLHGDTARVGRYGARFACVVFPGETLKASIWKQGDGSAPSSPCLGATTPWRSQALS
jgi:acyl dehydratase